MKDVNKVLRTAYLAALQATGEAAYSKQVPDNITGNYIVYDVQDVSEVPLISGGVAISATMQVTIYTEANQYNSGDVADEIADKVYQQIYPNNQSTLTLPSAFHMTSTALVADVTRPYTLKGQLIANDRVITFRHRIFVK